MAQLRTSAEAAKILGVRRESLITIIGRHPHLRPAIQIASGELLWADEEIEAVANRNRRRGRPAKTQSS